MIEAIVIFAVCGILRNFADTAIGRIAAEIVQKMKTLIRFGLSAYQILMGL